MSAAQGANPLTESGRLLLHVGLPKSGTSYLQSVLRNNLDALGADGVALVPQGRAGTFQVALQVRGKLREEDGRRAQFALDRFERKLSRCTEPTALLTQEALAPSTPEQAQALLERAGERDVHVIVTARDFARQLASAWQQRMKSRHTYSFAELVRAIRNQEEPALDLWRNQDLPQIVANWSSITTAERVHLVTSPRPGTDGDLLERFCQVLGVDAMRLELDGARRNASIGHVQAELLRRVNVALGDRLPSVRHGYGRVAKTWLAHEILQRQVGVPARLPEAMREWCNEMSAEWIDALRQAGCHVVGDLGDLVPPDSAFSDSPEPSEGELLEAAAQALADILQERHDEGCADRDGSEC